MRYLNFKDTYTPFLRPVQQKGLETMINPESVKITKAQTLASVGFFFKRNNKCREK